MGLQIYKPTPYNSGCACTFSFSTRVAKNKKDKEENGCEKAVFGEFIQQTSWDKNSRTGIFKGGLQSNTKFSLTEVADMINALENNTHAFRQPKPGADGKPNYSAFHKSEKGMSVVRLGPYYDKDNPKLQKGFSFSVNRKIDGQNQNFSVSLTRAEMKLVELYLKFALERIFVAQESEEKNLRSEYFKNKNSKETAADAGTTG